MQRESPIWRSIVRLPLVLAPLQFSNRPPFSKASSRKSSLWCQPFSSASGFSVLFRRRPDAHCNWQVGQFAADSDVRDYTSVCLWQRIRGPTVASRPSLPSQLKCPDLISATGRSIQQFWPLSGARIVQLATRCNIPRDPPAKSSSGLFKNANVAVKLGPGERQLVTQPTRRPLTKSLD